MPPLAEAAPKEEVKQPEQQFETKERKKKTFKSIKFSTSNFALAPKARRDMTDIEDELTRGDFMILDLKQARNDLEGYSYEMRSNLESYGSFEKYLDEETKKTFLAEINVVVEWIYGEGETSTLEEYTKRLTRFREIGEPVKQRHFYYTEVDVYFSQVEALKKKILERAATIEHITDEQKENINKNIQLADTFFAGVQADKAAKKLHENPAYNVNQI